MEVVPVVRTLTHSQESLKDGYDISSSINRIRFDGLASGVYRQVGAKLESIVREVGLDLAQIDEVLLAGASTLFPGLQNSLALQVQPTTPVTAAIDPAEVIAIGCVLTALHLSTLEDGLKAEDVLAYGAKPVGTLAKPIGLAIPGQEGNELIKLINAGAPLPTRRRVALPVESGVSKVAVEIWEGKDEVKVEKVERAPVEKSEDDDEEDDEEEDEEEETKTPVTIKEKAVGGVEVEVKNGKNVLLEVIVQRGGGVEVRAWEEGNEEGAVKFEA